MIVTFAYLYGIDVGVLNQELLDSESFAEMRGLIDGAESRRFVRVQTHAQLLVSFCRREDEVANFGDARSATEQKHLTVVEKVDKVGMGTSETPVIYLACATWLRQFSTYQFNELKSKI